MKKISTILLISFMALFLGLGSASATPTLMLIDSLTSEVVTVEDTDGDGVVTYYGNVGTGTWEVNITTGLTKPLLGSESFPRMDLNSVNVTSLSGGSIDIYFSEDNFSLDPSVTGFICDIGGTTDGTVSANAYLDGGLFGQSRQIGEFGPFGPGAFSDSDAWFGDPIDSYYSLTLMANITHTGVGQVSSFDFGLSPIPEPATMLLLGVGLIGLAGVGRKKILKKT